MQGREYYRRYGRYNTQKYRAKHQILPVLNHHLRNSYCFYPKKNFMMNIGFHSLNLVNHVLLIMITFLNLNLLAMKIIFLLKKKIYKFTRTIQNFLEKIQALKE